MQPTFLFQLCATLGTTGACAFDNLKEVGPICKFNILHLKKNLILQFHWHRSIKDVLFHVCNIIVCDSSESSERTVRGNPHPGLSLVEATQLESDVLF